MKLSEALAIAEKVKDQLAPHCIKIEIAGSIRRKKEEVKDIEIVAIPKAYQTGLFEDGIASVVNKWQKIKGELPCKYTQRMLPEGIKLDLFFAEHGNWGLIYAIRTGSAEYSHKVLATEWVKRGYKGENGYLTVNGNQILIPEEKDLFTRLGLPYVEPENRNLEKEDLFKTNCIRTSSGIYINVFEPTEEMICIEDIAHSLAYQCRFGGHLPEFYSVAQHSVICMLNVPEELKLEALLHDASEAYLLDMPKPIKERLPEYKRVEDNLMRVIAKKFGFTYPLNKEVKETDARILQSEWNDLMINNTPGLCWSPSKAKESFLTWFEELK